MGEAKRRREREAKLKAEQPHIPYEKCSAGNIAVYCCVGDPWELLSTLGEIGYRLYGEPLYPEVIKVAQEFNLDPHTLDHHVEGLHGWGPLNEDYEKHVRVAALCILNNNCQIDDEFY